MRTEKEKHRKKITEKPKIRVALPHAAGLAWGGASCLFRKDTGGGIRKASERRGKRTAQPNLDLFPLFSYHCTRYRDIVQPDMDTSTSR